MNLLPTITPQLAVNRTTTYRTASRTGLGSSAHGSAFLELPPLNNIVLAALAIYQVLRVYNWTTLAVITYDDYSMNSRLRDSLSVLTMNGIIGTLFCQKPKFS